MPLFAPVHFHDVLRVDGEVFVGIYDNTEEARVCLEKETQREQSQSKCNSSGHLSSPYIYLR